MSFRSLFSFHAESFAYRLVLFLPTRWSDTTARVINTESNSATLIQQQPGEGNRRHYHPDWNEWWYILKGPWKWEIDGTERVVDTGDFVFMKKGRNHKITACGKSLSIRMAVSRYDVEHVYP